MPASPPLFGHHPATDYVDTVGGSPTSGRGPAMGHHNPDHGGLAPSAPVGARTGRVLAAELPATPVRRRPGQQFEEAVAVGFVRGDLQRLPPSTHQTGADEHALKLARAGELLAQEPAALEIVKHHLLRSFAALHAPPSASISQWVRFDPSWLRLALELHNIRFDFIEARTDEERLVVLSEGEARLRRHIAYSDAESRRLAAEDRAGSVSLIGQVLGIDGLANNVELDASFFDDVAGLEEAP